MIPDWVKREKPLNQILICWLYYILLFFHFDVQLVFYPAAVLWCRNESVVLEKLFEVSDVQREQSENCRQRLALQPHVGAKMEVECNPVLHLGGWPVFICGCLDSSSYCDYRLDLGHLKCTTGCYCLGVSFNCLTGMHWCISLSANKMAFTAGIESALKLKSLIATLLWHT